MFHNQSLRDKYLPETLPQVFLDKKRRLLVYLMRTLHDNNENVTIDNMLMVQSKTSERLDAFMKQHKVSKLSEGDITDMLYDPTVDSREVFFDNCKDEILKASFTRFVEDLTSDIKYYNDLNNAKYHSYILSRTKALQKIHTIIYNRMGNKRDVYAETKDKINNPNEYIPTSSRVLNSYIGGFTRGYIATIFAKSSHGKSSWVDYNILQNILSDKVASVGKITPEEDVSTQLTRYVAMICKLPTSGMRLKTVQTTDMHMQVVKSKLDGRLIIHDDVFKMKDIIELTESMKTDMIYLDHVNKIDYPGRGTHMERMIGNISELVNAQSRVAKTKHISIVNLSQVNDKEIQRSDRMMKAPRYWDLYGSSVLYQASREMIALWYPYKDQDDNPIMSEGSPPSINDIRIHIEKSSFSKVGRMSLRFEPDFNLFTDTNKDTQKMEKGNYLPPQEETLF
jgi:replicative DNA helicase